MGNKVTNQMQPSQKVLPVKRFNHQNGNQNDQNANNFNPSKEEMIVDNKLKVEQLKIDNQNPEKSLKQKRQRFPIKLQPLQQSKQEVPMALPILKAGQQQTNQQLQIIQFNQVLAVQAEPINEVLAVNQQIPISKQQSSFKICLSKYKYPIIALLVISIIIILIVILVLHFIVFVPTSTVMSTNKTFIPVYGEAQVYKVVQLKDKELFAHNVDMTVLVTYLQSPFSQFRRLQSSLYPCKIQIQNQLLGVTILAWSSNNIQVIIDPDQVLNNYQSVQIRLLEHIDRNLQNAKANNVFDYDDEANVQKSVEQMLKEVLAESLQTNEANIKLTYQQKYVGRFDADTDNFIIQRQITERLLTYNSKRSLQLFTKVLEPVKLRLKNYIELNVNNIRKYGNNIAETAGTIFNSDIQVTYQGQNSIINDTLPNDNSNNISDLLTSEKPNNRLLNQQVVSKEAYQNFVYCRGPKEKRICDKNGFVDPNRGQITSTWPINAKIKGSYNLKQISQILYE